MGCHRHQELEDKLTSDVGIAGATTSVVCPVLWKHPTLPGFEARSATIPSKVCLAMEIHLCISLQPRYVNDLNGFEAFIAAFLPRCHPPLPFLFVSQSWHLQHGEHASSQLCTHPVTKPARTLWCQNSDSQNWMHVTTCLALVAKHIPIGPNFWLHEEFLGFTEDFFLQDSLDSS